MIHKKKNVYPKKLCLSFKQIGFEKYLLTIETRKKSEDEKYECCYNVKEKFVWK